MKPLVTFLIALTSSPLSNVAMAAGSAAAAPAASPDNQPSHAPPAHPTQSALWLPGSQSVREQVRKERAFYAPGRPPPKDVKIVVPSRKILVPSAIRSSKLIEVHGAGSRSEMVEALAEHGAFQEATELSGKPTATENVKRSLPASIRRQAADLMLPGLKRVVSVYTPPPPPKDAEERKARVLDHFFLTGNMPGDTRVVREEGGPPVNDAAVNTVYENSGTVYSFYKAVLGRLSIDDKGMPLKSVVHQEEMDSNGNNRPMDNAYYRWDISVMHHGDGDGRGNGPRIRLGTSGHELTHGVTRLTAGLRYVGESGALNESFSDVLGQAVRQWKEAVTVEQADWRIGTDTPLLTAPSSVGPIRSMSNPNSLGQPAHMAQFRVMKHDDLHDMGGVHINSGIPNRAFYGAAMRIGGYVWDKSAKIWYVALRDYLREDATFADAARATIHVAGQLYGEGSREQAAVIAGWKDVGIHVSANDPAPMPRLAMARAMSDAK
jgi:hypothetical protein